MFIEALFINIRGHYIMFLYFMYFVLVYKTPGFVSRLLQVVMSGEVQQPVRQTGMFVHYMVIYSCFLYYRSDC